MLILFLTVNLINLISSSFPKIIKIQSLIKKKVIKNKLNINARNNAQLFNNSIWKLNFRNFIN